jgi:hypothetical protein
MKQILQALHKAASDVSYVQKKGYNDFQKYSYATEADVLEVVRPALLKHGLMMIPTIESVMHDEHGNTHITVRYDVYHESGETLSFVMAGSGNDRNSKGVGDKGIYKALTGCNKYAYLKALGLATGDDPEVEAKPEPKSEPKPEPKVEPKDEITDGPPIFSIIKEKPNALVEDVCKLAEAFLEDCVTVDQLRSFYAINKDTWQYLEKLDANRAGVLKAKFTDRSKELGKK